MCRSVRNMRVRRASTPQRLMWSSPSVATVVRTLHMPQTRSTAASTERTPLAPLRCPGGARMTSQDIRHLFKVPSSGYLAKYDQRFILNLKLTHQIMAHLSKTNKTNDKLLIELGPGAGALTRSLLTRPSFGVLGIEVDPRYNALLEQISSQTEGKFQWRNADVLKVDEFELVEEVYPRFARMHERQPASGSASGGAAGPMTNSHRANVLRNRRRKNQTNDSNSERKCDGSTEADEAPGDLQWWANGDCKVEVVGNLPFSIATELLMRYAVDCSMQRGLYRFGRVPLHFFVQKEIAERLTATPNTPQFSRLSVLSQNFFRVAIRQTFTEMTYFPRTEVLGCLATLEPRVAPLVDVNASVLINFVDMLMKPGMRNQMISKALHRCMPNEVVLYILQELRMDGSVLPAQLSTIEVARMARMWQAYLEATNQRSHKTSTQENGDEEFSEDEGSAPLHSAKKSSTTSSRGARSADAFHVERHYVTDAQKAIEFDWAREEQYAKRRREQQNGSRK